MRSSSSWAIAGIAFGAILAVGVPVGWSVSRPSATVGTAAAQAAARPFSTPIDPLAGSSKAGASDTPALDAGPSHSGTRARPPARVTGRSAPVRSVPTPPVAIPTVNGSVQRRSAPQIAPASVRIPAIGLTAPVRPTGVTAGGAAQVPDNVRTVGWYRYGQVPGAQSGATVLIGHVDSAAQGAGAFFRLRTAKLGETVRVVTTDGRTWTYRVIAREQWRKSNVPTQRLFSAQGRPRLVLITCGGPFDSQSKSYEDNLAVTAVAITGR